MTSTSTLGHPARVVAPVGTSPTKQIFGVYQGSVVSTGDPLNQGRVQVTVPQVLGSAVSNWASPLGQSSLVSPVTVNQYVYVMFIGGDINQPVYLPQKWSVAAPSPNLNLTGTLTVGGLSTFNASPPLKVSSGAALNNILVSDASGNMTLKHPTGNILTTYTGPANYSGTTVTSSSIATIASMTVAANDPTAGSIYELEVNGNGSWASTGVTLEFIVTYGGNQMTNLTLGANFFPGNQNFRWKMRTRVYCQTTGVSGTWVSELDGVASVFGTNILTNNQANASTGFVSCESSGSTTVDTTTSQTLALQVNWGGSGASITSQVIIPKRLA